MITALIACSLVVAPAKVDVREPAAIGSIMAARLSKVFGETITVDSSLADVPLIFNVPSVTFEEFRPIAAKGLDAEWRESGGSWQLYRLPTAIDQEDRAFLERRAADVRKQISEKVRTPNMGAEKLDEYALKIKLASDEELSDLLYEENFIPDEGMMHQVWTTLGADYFANLPIDKRFVFTSDGRKGSRRLPLLTDAIRQIADERNRVIAAMKSSGAWERLESSAEYSPDDFLDWMGVGEVSFAVLELACTESEIALYLSCFDGEGKSSTSFYDSVYLTEPERERFPDSLVGVKAALSPETQAIRKKLSEMMGDGHSDEFGDEGAVSLGMSASYDWLVDLFANLEERDLLSYDVSDVLFSLSDTLKKPLAGRLNDDLLDSMGSFSEMEEEAEADSLNLLMVLNGLDEHLMFDLEGGEIRVSPELPTRYQALLPRKTVAEYVRANRGKPLIDVNRLPELFVTRPSLDAQSIADAAMVVHGTEDYMFGGTEYSLIATWAALNPTQKRDAATARGTTIPLTRAGARLRKEFQYASIAYGQWSMLVGTLEGSEDEDYETGIEDWFLSDVTVDTLNTLQLNFTTKSRPTVRIYFDSDSTSITPEWLAEWAHMVETEKDEAATKMLRDARYAVEETLEVSMRYATPVGQMTMSSEVVIAQRGPKNLTLNQLPPEFVAEYRKALATLRGGG